MDRIDTDVTEFRKKGHFMSMLFQNESILTTSLHPIDEAASIIATNIELMVKTVFKTQFNLLKFNST